MMIAGTIRLLTIAACFFLAFPFTVRAQTTGGPRILLVQGTMSTPNVAERNYAGSVTRRIGRWLTEIDVQHRVATDEDVIRGIPRSITVVILGYNPMPPPAEISALRSFTRRGGKLLVFYSSSPGLAESMGVKLGEYKAFHRGGKWSVIRFNAVAPAFLPRTVRQTSLNIRPVFPLAGRSRLIASWKSAGGDDTGDPALVQSDAGIWMSHVLLDDGDTFAKKRMLLGLLGQYEHSVWPRAAAQCLRTTSRIGGTGSFGASANKIRRRAAMSSERGTAERELRNAEAIHRHLEQLFSDRNYPKVVSECPKLKSALVRAYAVTVKPRASEMRAVWDHSGLGLHGDWDQTCELLRKHGMTDILTNVLWPGVAHYDSRILAKSRVAKLHGDPLAECVRSAHRRGLKVHAWKVCWRLNGALPEAIKKYRDELRLQVSDTGKTLNWLCPSHPVNRKLELDAILEVARLYDIDGVHLDYIRYPNSHACYCNGCRRRFMTATGAVVKSWPSGAKKGETGRAYNRWRILQISSFVAQCRQALRKADKRIKLSAAVYGKYPSCATSVAQDWSAWIQSGLLDFICPMDYTEDNSRFRSYVREQKDLSGPYRTRLVPGIGVTATESRLDAVQVIDQILELRNAGAGGFVLFDLNTVLESEILPALSLGATSQK